MFAITIGALALATSLAAAAAQAEPQPAASATPPPLLCANGVGALVTRPTQTTTTCVVPRKLVLVESGADVETVHDPGANFAFSAYPDAEIRIGTNVRNVELDLLSPLAFRSSGTNAVGDVGAGLKTLFAQSGTWAWGASFSATAPTGTPPDRAPNGLGSAGAGTETFNLNAEGSLGSIFGYATTLGEETAAASVAGSVRRYGSFVPSFELTAAIAPRTTAFAEGWLQTDGEGPATAAHRWLDVGLQRDVGSTQFDLEYGTSNAVAPSAGDARIARHYAGFGISRLF